MSKLTRAWVEAQMERELERENVADAVRDLAALVTVHGYLCGTAPHEAAHRLEHHTDRAVAIADGGGHRDHEHLDKETIMAWVDDMENADGVRGGKYSWHQTQQHAMNIGITGQQRLLEMYWAMNAMYADYQSVAKKYGVDKPDFYAHLAKAFIEDPDAVDDKVEAYVEHIVKHG